MGNSQVTASVSSPATTSEPLKMTEAKPKCKACCACPETKRARDECIMQKGEENCGDFIEKHKQCMRDMGFKV
uniref:CSON009282 protein n=1 Tax=Culicoides sonorensis TaxID=179676 RepID=A0A336LGW4_CULSO